MSFSSSSDFEGFAGVFLRNHHFMAPSFMEHRGENWREKEAFLQAVIFRDLGFFP